MSLDIHPASDAERLDAYRNVHDVWSGGLSLEEHVQRRLQSVQHNRAKWFVGCVDGKVATSLAVYPLTFSLHGNILAGFSIGSVHTHAQHRGSGYAPQLIRWVEQHEQSQGAQLSMLYSDIKPEYYARLGYVRCPAWQGWTKPGQPRGGEDGGFRLLPCDAENELDDLMPCYQGYHAAAPLSIQRPRDYWNFLLHQWPQDEFNWLCDTSGQRLGYARLTRQKGETRIADYALADRDIALLEGLYKAVLAAESDRGSRRIGGWTPNSPAAQSCFEVTPRSMEITMLKPLTEEIQLDDSATEAADYFCEIDHV